MFRIKTATAAIALSLVAITSLSYAGERCGEVVEPRYVADPSLVPEGHTVLSEADALIVETFAFLQPVGEVERDQGVTSDGRPVSIARQSFVFSNGFGQQIAGQLQCSHQGCVDNDCILLGCDPVQVGNRFGCTGASCVEDPSTEEEDCNDTEPKGCIKSVSIELEQQPNDD